jgi:hypothetical protein
MTDHTAHQTKNLEMPPRKETCQQLLQPLNLKPVPAKWLATALQDWPEAKAKVVALASAQKVHPR